MMLEPLSSYCLSYIYAERLYILQYHLWLWWFWFFVALQEHRLWHHRWDTISPGHYVLEVIWSVERCCCLQLTVATLWWFMIVAPTHCLSLVDIVVDQHLPFMAIDKTSPSCFSRTVKALKVCSSFGHNLVESYNDLEQNWSKVD